MMNVSCFTNFIEGKRRYSEEDEAADTKAEKEKKEAEVLDEMLKGSEVLALIEKEQARHEKRLNELQNRLEKELISVQEHFETVMAKLRVTEQQLEENLRNVERSMSTRVEETRKSVRASGNSWLFPFIGLVIVMLGVAGFFGNLYRKATKHSRML
jgi:hypothetical protein